MDHDYVNYDLVDAWIDLERARALEMRSEFHPFAACTAALATVAVFVVCLLLHFYS